MGELGIGVGERWQSAGLVAALVQTLVDVDKRKWGDETSS
jgi:hypothetical protein